MPSFCYTLNVEDIGTGKHKLMTTMMSYVHGEEREQREESEAFTLNTSCPVDLQIIDNIYCTTKYIKIKYLASHNFACQCSLWSAFEQMVT